MGGLKNDTGKPCFDRLSFQALGEMNRVHEAGDKKYDEGNWRKGLDVKRLCNAAIRHISQFLDGELRDKETETLHVANAAVSLEMVIHMLLNEDKYKEFINLPKRPTPNKTYRDVNKLLVGNIQQDEKCYMPYNWQELQVKDQEELAKKADIKDLKILTFPSTESYNKTTFDYCKKSFYDEIPNSRQELQAKDEEELAKKVVKKDIEITESIYKDIDLGGS